MTKHKLWFLGLFVAMTVGLTSAAHAQIDFGRYFIKQNGKEVGRLVVVPGYNNDKIEYYFLYAKKHDSLFPFTEPSQQNPNTHMEFVFEDFSPGQGFDPFAFQFALPVSNRLIEATCVDFGISG